MTLDPRFGGFFFPFVSMIGILWNCLGTVKASFRRSSRYLLRKYKPDFIALFETHCAGDQAQSICDKLGFDSGDRVEGEGQSGGIWLYWHSNTCKLKVIMKDKQFIHAVVGEGSSTFHLFVVYICPNPAMRNNIWDRLSSILTTITEPIVFGGDLNVIANINERSGGSGRLSNDYLKFRKWLEDNHLIDLGF